MSSKAGKQTKPSIIEVMEDPRLFRPWFKGDSWARWRVFLKSLFDLELTDSEREDFTRFTGREQPPEAVNEAWLVVGRRGGKSLIAAFVAVYLACFRDYREFLQPGETGTVMVIATDRKQATVVLNYIRAFFGEIPMLSQLVARETRESIELKSGISVEVHTCSYRSIRGRTVIAGVLDEVAFWRDESSANPAGEVVSALRPSMVTIPTARLIALSSPYSRSGELWRMYDRHYGKDSSVLVWQASSREMNSTIPEDVIAEAYRRDPAAAAAEWDAKFRRDIESFISREAVDAATVPGRLELPRCDFRYLGFTDPSGGARDSFTLAISHREEDLIVLDLVREVRPPFSPESVVEEFSELLSAYGLSRVTGDRYGGEWPAEQFRKRGITYIASPKTKSELYQELLPLLNSGRCELLDIERLRFQLLNLERRTSRGGRDSIDHPPNGSDDVINAAAGAVVLSKKRRCGAYMVPIEGF